MIRKRNLDNSLVQWIMTVTGLGPGLGDFHWVGAATSATSQFKSWLETDLGVGETIYSKASLAFAQATAYRNDVIFVLPGAYAETASLTWSKAHTHMIGLSGPNCLGDYSEPGAVVYTATSAVASAVEVTGQNCQFHGINFQNAYANAGNLCALDLDKYGCVFKNCAFQGNMAATQSATVAAASLYISGAGMYPIFEDCLIGQDVWSIRTGALSGQLRFTDAGEAPNGGIFKSCMFKSLSNTNTVAMVAVPSVDAIGRSWIFDNCFFFNHSTTQTNMNQVFYLANTGSDNIPILLHHCVAVGYDEWQDADNAGLYSDMPVATVGGGLVIQPTATVS